MESEAYLKVKDMSRSELLTNSDPIQQPGIGDLDSNSDAGDELEKPKVFSITTYNPAGNPNQLLIKGNWNLLGKSNTTFHLYRHQVVHGYRRPPNLRDMLVHSRLKIIQPTQPGISGKPDHHKECKDRNCRYCPRFNQLGHITSPTTKVKSKCCTNYTCHSSNLIYCLRCTHCNLLYVGQTKRELKKRLVEHFSYITKPDLTQPLGKHFNLPGHPKLDAVEIYVLKFIRGHPDSTHSKAMRDEHELRWIHRLRSVLPHGLNSMD